MSTINVLAAPTQESDRKSLVSRPAHAVLSKIDLAVLKSNLKALQQQIGELLSVVETQGAWKLKTAEIGVEITAEGGFNLIGSVTVGGTASLTLTFERD